MIAVIQSFDGMEVPQGASEPMQVSLIRQIFATDGSEYWLADPADSFPYQTADGRMIDVSNVIVSPGWAGQSLRPGFEGRINLAYVIDQSVLTDEVLDFSKCAYVAFGYGFVPSEATI